MNLKLKRATRSSHSEEIVIFNADDVDANGTAVNIGKIDVHYLDDQVVGTLLLWEEFTTGYVRTHGGSQEAIDAVIDQIMSEITDPLGVAGEYGIEVYFPSALSYRFFSSYADEQGSSAAGDQAPEDDESYNDQGSYYGEDEESEQQAEPDAGQQGSGGIDDFARQLRSRT
jgi:hypothetical protein